MFIVPSTHWLRNSLWDSFWMLSGIWLIPVIFLAPLFPNALFLILGSSSLALWLSHRFATAYTAFCFPSYRALIFEQRNRFIFLPLIILAITGLFFFVVPIKFEVKILISGTVFFLINTYHFGVQHFGVMTIYKIRSGQKTSEWLRNYERLFCILVGGILVAVAQICTGAQVVKDSVIYHVISREMILNFFMILKIVIPLFILIFGFILIFFEFKEKVSFPKVIYLISLIIQGISAYFLAPLQFLILWAVQHWLISVALVGHMGENEQHSLATTDWYKFWFFFNRRFWTIVLLLGTLSVLLTPFFEIVIHPDRLNSIHILKPIFELLLQNNLLAEGISTIGFATVFIHFVLDRAVFRFSNESVRKVTGPLLFKR